MSCYTASTSAKRKYDAGLQLGYNWVITIGPVSLRGAQLIITIKIETTICRHMRACWHICKSKLVKINKFEFQFLRKLIWLCRKASETRQHYNARTSKRMPDLCTEDRCQMLHNRILIAVLRDACREKSMATPGGIQHLRNLLTSHTYQILVGWREARKPLVQNAP